MMARLLRTGLALALALTLSALAVAPATARELTEVRPERVGMSGERLERITTLARRYVDEGKLAGVVVQVNRHGKLVHTTAVGRLDIEQDTPIGPDSLLRIYSMSKPITAVAAMILYERGAFQLSDPVSKFLPELKDLKVLADGSEVPVATPMTMQQLLSHTAGFSYGFNPDDPIDKRYRDDKVMLAKNLDEFVGKLAGIPLKFQPGTQWHYSVAVDVTGAVIERISGQRFDVFLKENIFDPLDMTSTFFDIPAGRRGELGKNHRWDAEAGKLVAFQEEGYPVWADTTFFSGGGGLVSTARDYMRFAEMLRAGGVLDGQRILGPKTIELMTMDHLPAAVAGSGNGESPTTSVGRQMGFGFGLGFGINTDVAGSGVVGSPGEYSWGGAAGTIFWVDPVEDVVVVGMIQLMQSPWPLRSELKVLANQAITELNP